MFWALLFIYSLGVLVVAVSFEVVIRDDAREFDLYGARSTAVLLSFLWPLLPVAIPIMLWDIERSGRNRR